MGAGGLDPLTTPSPPGGGRITPICVRLVADAGGATGVPHALGESGNLGAAATRARLRPTSGEGVGGQTRICFAASLFRIFKTELGWFSSPVEPERRIPDSRTPNLSEGGNKGNRRTNVVLQRCLLRLCPPCSDPLGRSTRGWRQAAAVNCLLSTLERHLHAGSRRT